MSIRQSVLVLAGLHVAVSLGCGSAQSTSGTGGTTLVGEGPGGLAIVAGEPTPVGDGAPSVFHAGQQHARYQPGQVIELKIVVRDWELVPGGNHVHVVVDDHSSIPVFDVSEPIDVWNLHREELGGELEEGWHFVRFFLCRGNHESVKTEGAFGTMSFFYGEAPPNPTADTALPMLTYSQPHGCYSGENAERVRLDFYVTNAFLGLHDHGIRVSIDGQRLGLPLTEWVPYFLTGLAPGEHEVRVELLDSRGDPASGEYASGAETIRIAAPGEECP